MSTICRATVLAIACHVVINPGAAAQSLLDRPPNISGNWVAPSGTVMFNFLHRFISSNAPERKVSNFPTFLVGVGLPARSMLGFHYSTNSTLTSRYPNEWEFFARHVFLSQDDGAPIDIAAQAGYNLAAEGVDGEISLGERLGRARLLGAVRVLSSPDDGSYGFALAAGGTLRLHRYVALAGDVASLVDRDEVRGDRTAWSAGVHLAFPNSPHTLSLQVTNTNTATMQGASRGSTERRYGFELVVPITLARYFGRGATPPRVAASPKGQTPGPTPGTPADTAGARIPQRTLNAGIKNMTFTPRTIEITAGTTVIWRNNEDQLPHTVTADDASFDSGILGPGATWSHTFETPGEYPFHCTPHPFMKGMVVVK